MNAIKLNKKWSRRNHTELTNAYATNPSKFMIVCDVITASRSSSTVHRFVIRVVPSSIQRFEDLHRQIQLVLLSYARTEREAVSKMNKITYRIEHVLNLSLSPFQFPIASSSSPSVGFRFCEFLRDCVLLIVVVIDVNHYDWFLLNCCCKFASSSAEFSISKEWMEEQFDEKWMKNMDWIEKG